MAKEDIQVNHLQERKSPFREVLLLDLRRSVCSLRFLFGICSILVWMIVNIGYEFLHYDYALESGAVYLLRMALDGSNMGPVLLVIAAIPYATTFYPKKSAVSGWKWKNARELIDTVSAK